MIPQYYDEILVQDGEKRGEWEREDIKREHSKAVSR
jgi:hypothetical protein